MLTIYGKPNCKYCDMAKTLLDMDHTEYRYVDVHQDEAALSKLLDVGFKSVPQVYDGDRYIGGFKELKEAHDANHQAVM